MQGYYSSEEEEEEGESHDKYAFLKNSTARSKKSE